MTRSGCFILLVMITGHDGKRKMSIFLSGYLVLSNIKFSSNQTHINKIKKNNLSQVYKNIYREDIRALPWENVS